jgi:hypothetical protein
VGDPALTATLRDREEEKGQSAKMVENAVKVVLLDIGECTSLDLI